MANTSLPHNSLIERDIAKDSFLQIHSSKTLKSSHLPIKQYQNHILYALEKYSCLILIGETGCGKSTQLPLFLHSGGWTKKRDTTSNEKVILCTQPRRLAVTNLCKRVAYEFGCQVGEEVGYSMRFESKVSSKTIIKFCTDGVLLRETLSDPLLSKYSVIIVDEAHERTLHTDILLGILKKILMKRKDLRIIITSASINAQEFKDYFEFNRIEEYGSHKISHDNEIACMLSVGMKPYPIDIYYLNQPTDNYIHASFDTIQYIHKTNSNTSGNILVFLPGAEEIDVLIDKLQNHFHETSNLIAIPLYASLPISQQYEAISLSSQLNSIRKVIVSTNIAETSLTIENISYVIDCGLVKLSYYDIKASIDLLVTCPISQASAIQRAGRCGRLGSGKCYRLYTEESYQQLQAFTIPEMQRVDISWSLLQLKGLGIRNLVKFDFISSPSITSMINSLEVLYALDAINKNNELTSLGEHMIEMPIDIYLSRALLSSYDLQCSEDILTITAMCSVEYPFHLPPNSKSSEVYKEYWKSISEFAVKEGDHITLLHVYNQFILNNMSKQWCNEMKLHYHILIRAKEIRSNLYKMLIYYLQQRYHKKDILLHSTKQTDTIRKCILIGKSISLIYILIYLLMYINVIRLFYSCC